MTRTRRTLEAEAPTPGVIRHHAHAITVRRTGMSFRPSLKEDEMEAEAGARIVVEAEKLGQATRRGIIEEVLAGIRPGPESAYRRPRGLM